MSDKTIREVAGGRKVPPTGNPPAGSSGVSRPRDRWQHVAHRGAESFHCFCRDDGDHQVGEEK
jgi:hypothetical protein